MAIELLHRKTDLDSSEKETLYLLSGVALVIFGAGLILSSPTVRRYLSQVGWGSFATAALPDLERYFRLRSM